MLNISRSSVLSLFLIFLFSGCATPKSSVQAIAPVVPTLNYDEVQERLGIQMGAAETGYREKPFDACDLPEPLADCHHAYFIFLRFRLSCRASEEASEVLTEGDLQSVANQKLIWKIGKINGESYSDASGYGIIRAIADGSQKKAYLRLSTGSDYLMMKASEVTAIVTPPAWCQLH